MRQGRLNDAAIALDRVLTRHGIRFGMFGGGAVALKGGPRESKDLDMLVIGHDKNRLQSLLDNHDGFRAMPGSRNDVAIFLWSNTPNDSASWVTVELFVGVSDMRPTQTVQIRGDTEGNGVTYILDDVYIFKGKLRAAATRDKYSDAVDLVWLEKHHGAAIRAGSPQYDRLFVGLALKRFPHLHYAFERIGIDLAAAREAAKNVSLESMLSQQPGDVQRGILG